MGILLKSEILRRMKLGTIVINPFDDDQLNKNSYNLTIGPELLVSIDHELDMKKPSDFDTVIMDTVEGYLLQPSEFYLASTIEHTATYDCIPIIEGRSGTGRLNLSIHTTAGLGDIGFCGQWTLELSVIKPLRIYPYTQICQIFYTNGIGDIESEGGYNGSYQNQCGPQPSKIWKTLRRK